MNTLIQQKSLLVGSEEAIEELENKKSARLLVLADSHGEYKLLEAIIKEFGPECDAIIFCGDGNEDFVACVENANYDEDLKAALPPVLATVKGNCDEESYSIQKNESENEETQPFQLSERQLLKVANRNVFFVHGHKHGVDLGIETLSLTASALDADMVFFAHTHKPFRCETEATLMLNPGSISKPRGGFNATFAFVSFPGETERYSVEFFTIVEPFFGGYKFELASDIC